MAEQGVINKVEDIIKCAVCREVLTDPKTFLCLHSYCAKCIKSLPEETKDESTGYTCPECRQFTPKDGLRVVHLVIQLLDAYNTAKRAPGETKCDICSSKEEAKWSCLECDDNRFICDTCKPLHDKIVKHQVISIDDMRDEHRVLEKPMYCQVHKKYEIEVFCQEHEETMCVMCKMFKHDKCTAEPIEDAIQRLLPEMTSSKNKIDENIKESQKVVNMLKEEKQAAIQTCDEEQQELDTKMEEDIRKIKEQHKKDSADLQGRKTASTKELDNEMQEINDKINEQEQVGKWVDTFAKRTKGTCLLQEMQDGLLKKCKHMASDPGYGGLSENTIWSSRSWPWENGKGTWSLQGSMAVPNSSGGNYPYTRISVLWDNVWMIHHNGRQVYKYSFDGTQTENFLISQDISVPRVAIETGTNEAVLVSQSGLHTINQQGQVMTTIHKADFSDACFGTDRILYALEYKQGKVMRFKRAGYTWKNLSDIKLQNYQTENTVSNYNYVNTLVVKEENIYVCMVNNHRIKRYDMAGNIVREIGTNATGFGLPSICGIYPGNALLIANYNVRTLDMLDNNGTRTQLPGYSSSHPWYAAFLNSTTLWVIDNVNNLHRYAFKSG